MNKRIITICTGVALLTAATLMAKSSGFFHRGTDILHLSLLTIMDNEGVLTNAAGFVDLSRNEQGKVDHQSLVILLRGLETNTTYQLQALLSDDTNFTSVTNFISDANGRAALNYRSVVFGPKKNHGGGRGGGHDNKGHGGGLGRGRSALPSALDPVSDIDALTILNGSTQAVLTADLTSPDKLAYLVKRDLSNTNGVNALLRILATTRRAQLLLAASGLNPTNDYFLVLNGGIVQTNATDQMGRLFLFSRFEPATNILQVETLALWDGSSNVVVHTTLP